MQVSPLVPAGQAPQTPSQMSANAKSADLLYVADQNTNDVYVYSWPQGKLTGTLTGFTSPSGLCSDAKGDVYVPNYLSQDILEYAHGGTTPIKQLKDDGYYPFSCSVDSTTGNLAVNNLSGVSMSAGNVVIYKNAAGKPKAYGDPELFQTYFCSYDDRGNLFVSGANSSYTNVFAELPKGAGTFTNITLLKHISSLNNVQSDGHVLTVGNEVPGVIYKVKISGSTGKLEDRTSLNGTYYFFQYAFAGGAVVGANVRSFGSQPIGNVMVWRYPGGGTPTKIIRGLEKPIGVTISLAAK